MTLLAEDDLFFVVTVSQLKQYSGKAGSGCERSRLLKLLAVKTPKSQDEHRKQEVSNSRMDNTCVCLSCLGERNVTAKTGLMADDGKDVV